MVFINTRLSHSASIVLVVVATLCLTSTPARAVSPAPIINEVMSANSATLADEDGSYEDWIELYNPGPGSLNLAGYRLTDNTAIPDKWVFPSVTISAGGYIIVFASGKDSTVAPHANFKLSAEGETLLLTDPAGAWCDSLALGAIPAGWSRGRKPSGGASIVFFQTPTPAAPNGQGYAVISPAVVTMSVAAGFHTPFSLTIAVDSPTAVVRYTRDGSEPTASSPAITPATPIAIDTTTVVRARAFETGFMPGPIVTTTYIIGYTSTLPVISLSTTPANLWDADIGIYVKGSSTSRGGYPSAPTKPETGANWNEDWERPVHIEFFEPDGSLGFAADAGIQITGKQIRTCPQKSLAVFFRGDYGMDELEYQLFPDNPVDTFKSFVLRNSGQDWVSTMFRDALQQGLVSSLDLDTQAYRPSVVFINGVYWGIHNIREKLNEDYLSSHHGVDSDKVDILDNYHVLYPLVIEGSAADYNNLIDYIQSHNLANQNYYDYVATQIDIDHFIDYIEERIYSADGDGTGHNCKFWRPQTPGGKWRWMLYDTDFGFALTETSFNMTSSIPTGDRAEGLNLFEYYLNEDPNASFATSQKPEYNFLLVNLMKNASFKHRFINRFADRLNTIFLPSVVKAQIAEKKAALASEIPHHIARWKNFKNDYYEWGSYEGYPFPSVAEWEKKISRMERFADARPAYVRTHMMQTLGIAGSLTVTLASNNAQAGTVTISTVTPATLPWFGVYYKNIPVEISATPKPGYRFTGWTGLPAGADATSNTVTATFTTNATVTANFTQDATALNTIVINEINYNSADDFDPDDWVELYSTYTAPVDLGGWVFRDEDDAHAFVIPPGTTIAPGGYLVMATDLATFSALFPNVQNVIGNFPFGLNNNGESVRLFTQQGTIADSLTFDNNDPWPIATDGTGATLALRSPSLDNTLAVSWGASTGHGTPGAVNDLMTIVQKQDSHPNAWSVGQNYPNPFNPTTTIPFSVPEAGRVVVSIFSLTGQKIATILDENLSPGQYTVHFDAVTLSSGVYFYTITADSHRETKRMLLMK